ncbi:hypothetical protein F5Y13DRAFT_171128 [Hypoxylon sp. FL1857]|nr:hypothetical protein F5Y13DRAFT_171128 [Hypoxylon sp. FL1857]
MGALRQSSTCAVTELHRPRRLRRLETSSSGTTGSRFWRHQSPAAHSRWLLACASGEIIPATRRLSILNPRGGFPVTGICDRWYGCKENDEHTDATSPTMMTDIIPSLSHTLLHHGGLYDAHAFFRKLGKWAGGQPGLPAKISNLVAEAMREGNITFSVSITQQIG